MSFGSLFFSSSGIRLSLIHILVILLIGAVHAGGAAVDNGFLLCAEVTAADELLAQGHNKLRRCV